MVELKNAGRLKGMNAKGVSGTIQDGDVIKMFLVIDDKGIIQDAKFKAFGCVVSIAVCDALCDIVRGKSIDIIHTIKESKIIDTLGELPDDKYYCPKLALEALSSAVKNWKKKQEKN